jgi:GTP-binding protein
MDLPDVQERWPAIQKELKRRIRQLGSKINVDPEPLAISAATGQNTRPLLYRAVQLLAEAPPPPSPADLPVYRAEADPRAFSIEQTEDGWKVSGPAIERAAQMTYWEHYDSVRRFQRVLSALGVEKALREAGVQNGDTVYIGDYELEWQD